MGPERGAARVHPPGPLRDDQKLPCRELLLLEAGVRNASWFFADDKNITMSVDLDLRLDAVTVHSRPDPILG